MPSQIALPFPFMNLLCSIISVNYKTEMYNKMVLSESAAAIAVLRKKCEKWQGSSISEYTMTAPPQLMSSVLVERVNTLLSSMKKEMAIMDSNFCNELRNLKRYLVNQTCNLLANARTGCAFCPGSCSSS